MRAVVVMLVLAAGVALYVGVQRSAPAAPPAGGPAGGVQPVVP